jgi:HSP20 family protein
MSPQALQPFHKGIYIMLSIRRYDPFDDRFEDLFRSFLRPPVSRGQGAAQPIRIDVTEDENKYVVQAEIPGTNKDDINVSIDGNQVSIAAEVKRENEAKEDGKVLRTERYFGKTYRSFVLGQEVDKDTAQARYANGVLELTLPKRAAPTVHKLTIQ